MSNADFCLKILELRSTINDNQAEVIIISESNAEVGDPEKMTLRACDFPDYHFENKFVTGIQSHMH